MKQWIRFGLCGAAAGLVNGFFGAGGGMVLVPLLISLGQLEDKQAFASVISIILPLSIMSLFIHGYQGTLDISGALPYLAGGLIGGLLGGVLFKKVSVSFLHKALGLVILWGGFRMLWT